MAKPPPGVPVVSPQAAQDYVNAQFGTVRNGTVGLRAFDEGVVETLGKALNPAATGTVFIENDSYWLTIPDSGLVVPGMDPPPQLPGIPITFSFPEDVFKTYKIPLLLIRRDDISPAMERWHPGTQQYQVPAPGAVPKTVTVGVPGTTMGASPERQVTGYPTVEMAEQAHPFDITYTLSCIAHYRGGISLRGAVNTLFTYVLKVYQAYNTVYVRDSIGTVRGYSGFMEGTTVLDEISEVTDRVLGFGITLRVEAELDLNDPQTSKTVGSPAVLGFSKLTAP